MIRQTPILPVQAGEPLLPVLNQLAQGASNGRVFSGDGDILSSSVGGLLGVANGMPAPINDRDVLVYVDPDDQYIVDANTAGGAQFGGGFYAGRLYLQPTIDGLKASRSSTEVPTAIPQQKTCFVLNLAEFDTSARLITKPMAVVGRIIGYDEDYRVPIVAVRVETAGVVRVKITGNATGGGKYTGTLVIGNGTGTESANLAAADIGTLGTSADAVIVYNLQELGQSTHDLSTSASNVYFLGVLTGKTTDTKKRIVIIDGTQWQNCTGGA